MSAPLSRVAAQEDAPNPWLGAAVDHYENFPVASILMPARLRPAVAAIYRFARHADDAADEGDASAEQRLAELGKLQAALISKDGAGVAVVEALLPHIERHRLDRALFADLLSAFAQDVQVSRYAGFDTLLDYCRRSANPIGRLVLQLFGRLDARTGPLSDTICSALQLINFLQDLAIDWRRGRLYLPVADLAAAGISEDRIAAALATGRCEPALRQCIAFQSERALRMLLAGRPLVAQVPFRLGLELRAIIAGGCQVLARLQRADFDPVAHRPRLTIADAPAILVKMLR